MEPLKESCIIEGWCDRPLCCVTFIYHVVFPIGDTCLLISLQSVCYDSPNTKQSCTGQGPVNYYIDNIYVPLY